MLELIKIIKQRLGVVHNCQHLPIRKESSKGGGGAETSYRHIFRMLIYYVEHIITSNASTIYYMVVNTTVYT